MHILSCILHRFLSFKETACRWWWGRPYNHHLNHNPHNHMGTSLYLQWQEQCKGSFKRLDILFTCSQDLKTFPLFVDPIWDMKFLLFLLDQLESGWVGSTNDSILRDAESWGDDLSLGCQSQNTKSQKGGEQGLSYIEMRGIIKRTFEEYLFTISYNYENCIIIPHICHFFYTSKIFGE